MEIVRQIIDEENYSKSWSKKPPFGNNNIDGAAWRGLFKDDHNILITEKGKNDIKINGQTVAFSVNLHPNLDKNLRSVKSNSLSLTRYIEAW